MKAALWLGNWKLPPAELSHLESDVPLYVCLCVFGSAECLQFAPYQSSTGLGSIKRLFSAERFLTRGEGCGQEKG